jgi:chromosome segregation ATPase
MESLEGELEEQHVLHQRHVNDIVVLQKKIRDTEEALNQATVECDWHRRKCETMDTDLTDCQQQLMALRMLRERLDASHAACARLESALAEKDAQLMALQQQQQQPTTRPQARRGGGDDHAKEEPPPILLPATQKVEMMAKPRRGGEHGSRSELLSEKKEKDYLPDLQSSLRTSLEADLNALLLDDRHAVHQSVSHDGRMESELNGTPHQHQHQHQQVGRINRVAAHLEAELTTARGELGLLHSTCMALESEVSKQQAKLVDLQSALEQSLREYGRVEEELATTKRNLDIFRAGDAQMESCASDLKKKMRESDQKGDIVDSHTVLVS